MKDILEAFPEGASICDCSGKFPLHLCLESGKTWETGVKEVFEASPSALYVQDPELCLYPFMMAAVFSSSCSSSSQRKMQKKQQNECHSFSGVTISPTDSTSELCKTLSLMELTTIYELLRKDPSQVQGGVRSY